MSLRVSMAAIPQNDKPLNFLNFATRNYISARVLYLEGQAYDAGVMAHEAIEKIMKALIYYLDKTKNYDKKHDLSFLRNILIHNFGYKNLIKEKEVFKYYKECYSYRYPDDKQPQSFGTGTTRIHIMDALFEYFHQECMNQIKDLDTKYKSGIYFESFRYYESGDLKDVRKIVTANELFTPEYLDKGMKYWHNKNIFVINEKGSYRNPFGNVIISRG